MKQLELIPAPTIEDHIRRLTRRYPHAPGAKAEGTSRAAAVSITEHAETLKHRALMAFSRGPKTADEVAAELGVSILAIRPRVTELYRLGLIQDTGARRENASGKLANVWEVR